MVKYEAKKFRSFEVELDGISKKAMEEHYKLYQGYVNKANEITEKLAALDKDPAKANPTYSDIRELKAEYTPAVGGEQNTVPIWNASVVLAMDVFEHAYYMDFGTGKSAYIDAFFRNIDWTLPEQITKDVLPDGM